MGAHKMAAANSSGTSCNRRSRIFPPIEWAMAITGTRNCAASGFGQVPYHDIQVLVISGKILDMHLAAIGQ